LSVFIEKNRLPRLIFTQIGVFCGLIIISAVALKPVQTVLHRGMNHIKANIIGKIESALGREIYYTSIRPTIFGSFEIRNLKIMSKPQEELPQYATLSIAKINISFLLRELLKGNKAVIHSVQIEKPEINLDSEYDRDLFDFFASGSNKSQELSLTQFFTANAKCAVNNFSLIFTNYVSSCRFQNLNLSLVLQNDIFYLDGMGNAEVDYSGFLDRSFSAQSGFSFNGSFYSNLETAMTTILMSDFHVAEHDKTLVRLFPLNVTIGFTNNTITLNVSHQDQFNIDFDYSMGEITASLKSDKFYFSDLIYDQDARNTLSGSAGLHYKTDGTVNYNAALYGVYSGDSFAIRGSGDEKLAAIDEFRFTMFPRSSSFPPGMLTFSGLIGFSPFTTDGSLVFEHFTLTGAGNLDAELRITSQGDSIAVNGEEVVFGNANFDFIDMRIYPAADKDWGITLSGLCDEGMINIDAIWNYKLFHMEAGVTFDSFSVYDMAGMLKPFTKNFSLPVFTDSYLQKTVVATEIFIITDFKQIMYNVPNLGIFYKDTKILLSVSGTNRQFSVNEGRINYADNEILLSSQLIFSNLNDFGFMVNAVYNDMSWDISGQILDKTALIITSTCGLNALGSITPAGGVSGYIEGLEFPLPINGKQAFLNFYINLRYESKERWLLEIQHFEIPDFNALNGSGHFLISGFADQDGAELSNFRYSDAINTLTGGAHFNWSRDFSSVSMNVVVSEGQIQDKPDDLVFSFDNYDITPDIIKNNAALPKNEKEYLYINGEINDNKIKLHAAASQLRIDRFVRYPAKTQLSAEAVFFWDSINLFNAQFFLKDINTRILQNSVQAQAFASITQNNLAIYNMYVDYADISAYIPSIHLNISDNFARAAMNVEGILFGNKYLYGVFELHSQFQPVNSWLQIEQALDSINGYIRANNFVYGDIMLTEPFIFNFSHLDGAFQLSGGPKNMIRLEMDKSGNFFAGLSSPFPIHSSVAGNYKNGFLDAHLSDFYIDMRALWALIPSVTAVHIDSGYIVGKLDIRGPLNDPEFFGTARGSSFKIRVPAFIESEIKLVPFQINLEGEELSFTDAVLTARNGEGIINGWFRFENWIPKRMGLDIVIPQTRPVPYRFEMPNFLAQGDLSGRMVLNLDEGLDVKGSLLINNTELGLNTEEIGQPRIIKEGSGSNFPVTVDMIITTGPSVEFIWPYSNMPILRANPHMGTVLFVTADILNRQFSLNGDINIRSGEVYYFERSFYIRRGTLVFRENELRFDPRLSARAEIRDRTDTGPVTISLIIDNESLLRFSPRFEANPVLTQLEIYSLLGQNLTGGQGDADMAQRFLLASTTDFLAQFVVIRQVERVIRNILHLDMFSVRTQILQNAFLGATGLTQESSSVDRNNRVGNYFDNTTVFGGKYISQDLFIQGMLSMRYDENDRSLGGVKFEPDIGVELQSPLFNIRWNFIPYHPENWWVNDNSITLTWSRSY
jgi:hypothetical protein